MEWAIVLGLGGLVAWIAWYYGRRESLKRTLREAKVWPIAELPEDTRGRIVGKAYRFDEVLTAPISGRMCLYYEVEVEQDHGKSSSIIIHEARGVPFFVIDETGRAIVDPRSSDVVLEVDHKTDSGSFDDATPVEEAFLQRHGKASKGWMFNKSLTYREAIIDIGEQVAVLGSGVREPDPDAPPGEGYRAGPRTRLRISGSSQHPLVISDALAAVQA